MFDVNRERIVSWNDDDVSNYFNYNVDWSIEPKENLKELLKQNAQNIRDNYDYLILYFSGGSDSTTMVNAFLDNNIWVDEIVTIVYDGLDFPCFDGKAASHYLKTKEYRGFYNTARLKVDNILNFIRSDNFLNDWTQNFSGAIHQLSRSSIDGLEKYGFVPTIFREGNIAHVFGVEAPKINKINDNYYIVHSLLPEMFFTGIMYQHYNVRFFSNREFPKLYVKQAHMLAKHMKKTGLKIISNAESAKVIRDTFNPLISPEKSSILTLLNTPNTPTELNLLVKTYQKHDDKFRDTYYQSVALQQFKVHYKTTHHINIKKKYDLLF